MRLGVTRLSDRSYNGLSQPVGSADTSVRPQNVDEAERGRIGASPGPRTN